MKKNRRKICFITGTRADYGILTPVMKAVELSDKLELQLVVTGMHLLPQFGRTIDEIKKDGFPVTAEVAIGMEDDGISMAHFVGEAINRFADVFKKYKPDILVVLGDRGEMLAGAIAANYLGISVAHIHGGEVSGHIDEVIRHAITKLSHIHFAATKKAKERIIKLGEKKENVHISGAPSLDCILNEVLPEKSKLFKKYNFNQDKSLFILIQHPVASELDVLENNVKKIVEAVASFNSQTLVIYPNSDAGGQKIIKILESYRDTSFFNLMKNVPHKDYLGFLKSSDVLIGNSSSGIIEAPSFGLPVVNIGSRQNNRERASNVVDVDYDEKQIIKAIKKALEYGTIAKKEKNPNHNPYGDGKASQRIVAVLEKTPLGNDLLSKQITY
ncbi:MAG: UDP-N-acetylglucosamine 2-epimerase [Patescibacteria group bacterium]